MSGTRVRRAVVAAMLLALVALVYTPGLRGPFVFDDLPNIVYQPYVAISHLDYHALRDAALTNVSGPLGRPLAALSFALDYYFGGQRFDPLVFKLTNLAIHLLDTLLVLFLAGALIDRLLGDGPPRPGVVRRALPLLGAAAWALHPIQLTSVLYVVQRMNSMAAAAVLAGLIAYVHGRERLEAGRPGALPRMYGGTFLGLVVGVFCKENAVLLPLFAAVIELCAFERRSLPPAARRVVVGYFLLFVALPVAIVGGWLAAHPQVVSQAYSDRAFTLGERLLSEARVLWLYVGMILVPRPDAYSLFHDDFRFSHGLLSPPSTLVALLAWAAVVGFAAYRYRRGDRLVPFAVAWFLAGQVLESTVVPLELVFEHRNYLASIGPLLVLPALLARGLSRASVSARVRAPVMLVALGAVALAPAMLTAERAYLWSSVGLLAQTEVSRHPDSYRAQAGWAGYLMSVGLGGDAYEYMRRADHLNRRDLSLLVDMARLVARRRLALATAPGRTSSTHPVAMPGSYDAPMVGQPAYLRRLATLIDAEIDRRLHEPRLPNDTLGAMLSLSRCIDHRNPACIALRPRLIGWLSLIGGRTELRPVVRASSYYEAAKLLVSAGRPRAALRPLEAAWRVDRSYLPVLAYRAAVLIEVGDLRRARAAIAVLRREQPLAIGLSKAQLATLEARLQRATEQASIAVHRPWIPHPR